MRDVRRIAGRNAVTVDERRVEILLQDASGLLLITAANFKRTAVVKQRACADQRQRAFGICQGIQPVIDKTNVATPCAALLFERPGRTSVKPVRERAEKFNRK